MRTIERKGKNKQKCAICIMIFLRKLIEINTFQIKKKEKKEPHHKN